MEQFLEWNMEILRVIASWRTTIGDLFFSTITYLGAEVMFFAVLLVVYWCIDKRTSYYLFAVSLTGNMILNAIKITCCIARPWVLDPSFEIVEAAREAATGYSFPSGHSLTAVSVWATLFMASKKKWVKIVAPIIVVLVPFSRMYLGVHTPFDVVVGTGIALACVAIFYPCYKNQERSEKCTVGVLIALTVIAIATSLYIILNHDNFPQGTDEEIANLANAYESAYLFLACVLAFFIAYIVDKKHPFDPAAPFWGQVLKYVVGAGIIFGIKSILKQPIIALCGGDTGIATGIRYFIVAILIAVVWPLTFPLWQKVGAKKRAKVETDSVDNNEAK